MRRRGIVLGVAAVMATTVALAAGTALAQAETSTIQVQGPTSFTVDNLCTGETILFEGDFHNVIHTTFNENGQHFVTNGGTRVTGTGLQTGDEYRLITAGAYVEYVESTGEGEGLFLNNEATTFHIISQGPSPDFIGHVVSKTTVDLIDQQPNTVFVAEVIGCTPEVETTRPPVE